MFVAFFALASAAPSGSVATNFDGYKHGEMTWVGSITPGGPNVQLNGTAPPIVAQILELNPEWQPATAMKRSIERRQWRDDGACGLVAGEVANAGATVDNINYLRAIGEAACGVDGHTCVTMICNHNSALELCNNNDYHFQTNCRYLAEGAAQLYNHCSQRDFKGQRFDTGNFNIVVRRGNCPG
ncbi:hypothetical protein Dda_0598 [Drechslerella dactyloides]|uniref:Uncharacterized protein n=1 Tax=Drechslerella dactyloides TaxID=74499 RepID=A0AAD6J603_DREDA|nr:hypothetical protein Dda_0598 [Drechslerella dactyloides]